MPTSTSASLSSTTSAPVEVEATIARLSAHRNVRGVMILSREGPIIRNSGAVFDGEAGKKYALVVKKIVDSCRAGIEEIGDGVSRYGLDIVAIIFTRFI
jgi:dynein light chain roadblock-type